MTLIGRMLRKSIRVPTSLVALIVSFALIGGLGAEPAPVSAAPFTCRISETFVMPTMDALVEEYGEGDLPGYFSFVAGVDARCRSRLVKGVYVYRAKVTMSSRLSAGWPEDLSEYPQGRDSSFRFYPVYTHGPTDLENLSSPISMWPTAFFQLQPGNPGALQASGTWLSELTELCVAERCSFTSEHTGTYSDPTGEGDFGIELDIDEACLPIIPSEDANTVLCQEEGDAEDPALYFHPGLSGARFTVSAELYFEPLMTWRR